MLDDIPEEYMQQIEPLFQIATALVKRNITALVDGGFTRDEAVQYLIANKSVVEASE